VGPKSDTRAKGENPARTKKGGKRGGTHDKGGLVVGEGQSCFYELREAINGPKRKAWWGIMGGGGNAQLHLRICSPAKKAVISKNKKGRMRKGGEHSMRATMTVGVLE